MKRMNDPNAVNVVLREVRGKGRGVFARRSFKRGELIERAATVIMREKSWMRHGRKTILDDYAYASGARDQNAAIVLGYVMLYNHSYSPNALLDESDDGRHTFEIHARRAIRKGEEILVNYNGDPFVLKDDDGDIVWFRVKGK